MSLIIDEKQRKEREERAKNLISQRNIVNNINTVNYAKMKNINLNPQTDEEKSFISKVDRANSLISSINPREDVPEPTLTDEQKAQSEENIKQFIDLIDKNRDEDENTFNQNEVGNMAYGQEENKDASSRKIMVQPSGERIIRESEIRHQEELKRDENMPLINKKLSENSDINVDQNISSNINLAQNDTNDLSKNGEISIANKADTNALKTDNDFKLQQEKSKKENNNIFVKGAIWIKDIVGSLGVSIGSKISRNRKNY